MLVIGFVSGDVLQVLVNYLLVKNVDVLGFYWGGYLKFNLVVLGDSLVELMDWYDCGWIMLYISYMVFLVEVDQVL